MTQDKASVCANRISTKHVILALAGALWAVPVAADTWTIQSWPARPRGGPGTFQATWANRVAPDPGEGVASFYSDHETASGERLRPDDPNDLTCARPEPSELGACLIVSHGDKSIRCRVNDVGPQPSLKRKIDLTPAGWRQLGLKPIDGLGRVTIKRCD